MGEDKAKTKSAMLNELESIKGLLLEDDDIPILQEVIEQQTEDTHSAKDLAFDDEGLDNEFDDEHFDEADFAEPAPAASFTGRPTSESANKPTARVIVEQQQDFFSSIHDTDTAEELLDSLDNLEEKTSRIAAHKHLADKPARPQLAKPVGENPFLPEHIRARLHGNNPPPLFASETARKIANTSKPVTQLGSTQSRFASRLSNAQQELIDSVIARVLPDIEKELRQRLEGMSRSMLDELNKH